METQIANALNALNSDLFYATTRNGVVFVYPEAAHPLTGGSSAVFRIEASSETTCTVYFLDSKGFAVDSEACAIEGLPASIEYDMIACGYKA